MIKIHNRLAKPIYDDITIPDFDPSYQGSFLGFEDELLSKTDEFFKKSIENKLNPLSSRRKVLVEDVWSKDGGLVKALKFLINFIDFYYMTAYEDSDIGEVKYTLEALKAMLEYVKSQPTQGNDDFFDEKKGFCYYQDNLKAAIQEDKRNSDKKDEEFLDLLEPLYKKDDLVSRRLEYYKTKLEVMKMSKQTGGAGKKFCWNDVFSKEKMEKTYKNVEQAYREQGESDRVHGAENGDARIAISTYTTDDGCRKFNTYARYHKFYGVNKQENAKIQEQVRLLDHTINKYPLEKEGIYYRGIGNLENLSYLLGKEDQKDFGKVNKRDVGAVADYINKNLKGKHLTDKGFSSASVNRKVSAFNFLGKVKQDDRIGAFIRINIKPGVPVLPIMSHTTVTGEEEMLLNRNQPLKIESAKVNSMGTLTINVTAEPPTSNTKD